MLRVVTSTMALKVPLATLHCQLLYRPAGVHRAERGTLSQRRRGVPDAGGSEARQGVPIRSHNLTLLTELDPGFQFDVLIQRRWLLARIKQHLMNNHQPPGSPICTIVFMVSGL